MPRGSKNESCREWISAGIKPSHFRFHSMASRSPTYCARLTLRLTFATRPSQFLRVQISEYQRGDISQFLNRLVSFFFAIARRRAALSLRDTKGDLHFEEARNKNWSVRLDLSLSNAIVSYRVSSRSSIHGIITLTGRDL